SYSSSYLGGTATMVPGARTPERWVLGHDPSWLESRMTGTELREIFAAPEFKQDLEEVSSNLAGTSQERPIVYLLAKYLRRQGKRFSLEKGRVDLFVDQERVEFKFNYDCCQEILDRELAEWDVGTVPSRRNRGDFGILPRLYKDVVVKEP